MRVFPRKRFRQILIRNAVKQAERDLPVRQRGLSTDIVLVRVTGFRFSVPSRVFMYPSGIRTRLLSQYDAMNSTAHPRLVWPTLAGNCLSNVG